MAVSCEPADLAEAAACFTCLTREQKELVRLYLLAVIAGGSTDPATLATEAACFVCLDENQKKLVNTYLLCQAANGGAAPTECLMETVPAGNEQLFGIFTYEDIPGVTELVWNGTTTLSGFDIESSSLVSFSAPNLVSVDPTDIQSGSSYFIFAGNSLETVSFPALTTTGSDVTVNILNSPSLTTISMPALTNVGIFGGSGNDALTSLNLPSLQSAVDFSFTTCASLATVSLANLATVAGSFLLFDCPLLTSVSVPSWVPTDGTNINFSNNGLNATSVELILRRCVLSGVGVCVINLSGGTNAGTASLNAQGQADVVTLGGQLTINP